MREEARQALGELKSFVYRNFVIIKSEKFVEACKESLKDAMSSLPKKTYGGAIFWCDQEDHEERGSKDRAASLVGPMVSHSTIRADVDVAIVLETISRHFAEANLKSKCPFRALPLTPEHRQLRLQWCQVRSMSNVTDW
ncbi:transposable element Tcb2 transposase [Trichonephila clavipes]|nr:transposable element Tcb2 transposase [Trichonephila clavipes]